MERLVNYDNKHSCSAAANAGVRVSNANDIHHFFLLHPAKRFPVSGVRREKAMPSRFSVTAAFHVVT